VNPSQVAACDGKQAFDDCTLDGVASARCYDGVCLPAGCGNGRMDPGELCDDGNTGAGDGCSPDCLSDETCGNNTVDIATGETCDDGNHLDHDGCSSACRLESARWMVRTGSPPPRYAGAMAWDAARDRVVVFGGNDVSSQHTVGTYEWDGASWFRTADGGPPITIYSPLAYDGTRIIAFTSGQTWAWDGAVWTGLPVVSPPTRSFFAMAYDSHRHRVVLFGGFDGFLGMHYNDTWEWDGTAWTHVMPANPPSPRAWSTMTYDPKRGVMVLSGGGLYLTTTTYPETWEYDGTSWRHVTSGDATTPIASVAGFDPGAQKVIAFASTSTNLGDFATMDTTMAWDGATWTTLSPATPPSPRNTPQIASTSRGVVLYGGSPSGGVANDTWEFKAGEWTQVIGPGPRTYPSIVNDLARQTILLFGGSDASNTPQSDTWELSGHRWLQRTGGAVPPARAQGQIAYDPLANQTVMFGGAGSTTFADTWTWDGQAWTQQFPTTTPTNYGPMAFDGHNVTMLAGAYTGPASVLDTWRWTGSNWINTTSSSSPLLRFQMAIGSDPLRGGIVMFGGRLPSQAGNVTDETWTFDGMTWTKRDVPIHPSARRGGTLAWNASRKTLVLVGDDFDVWEWNGSAWSQVAIAGVPAKRSNASATRALDGGGTLVLYGASVATTPTLYDEIWELRWDGPGALELCDGSDRDNDGLVRCDDPDCSLACTSCGDGVCDAQTEDCHSCPMDCTCQPICGDLVCDPGETCAGDCP